jgi:hypothetical protein
VNRKHFPARQWFYGSRPALPAPQEKDMENPSTHRRSIGLIVFFVSVLTLIAIWKDPQTES